CSDDTSTPDISTLSLHDALPIYAVNIPLRNSLLVKAYRDFAPGRRAIVFCVDVAHAKDVHRVFAEAGIRAATVWGALSRDQRRSDRKSTRLNSSHLVISYAVFCL